MRGMDASKRKAVSDYVESLLMAEIGNRCPLCGNFEGTSDTFTNHHINHNSSASEYWNLIRICDKCHKKNFMDKDDTKRDRKLRQIKKDLFRRVIGPASYEVLLLANEYERTVALPCLANSLLKLELICIFKKNVFSVGTAKGQSTFAEYKITEKGKELVLKLSL